MAWEKKKLGQVLKLEYGKPLDKSVRKVDGKYPAYGANGVKTRSDEFYCDSSSIIVGRKGSAGELTLTEERYWPLDVTYFVTFDEKEYNLMFLYYLLSRLDLPSLATGVKPGINRNNVYNIDIKTPPFPEQKRIVSILDRAFADIEKARANAEQNLKNARELFDSYLQKVFTEKGDGWEEEVLNTNVKFIDYRGRTPKKTEAGLRLITAKNVRPGYLQRDPEEFVAPDSYDGWMTRGIPLKGDVLFTTEAPLGYVAQLDTDEKVVFAQRIITLQPNRNRINETFLKYMIQSEPIQRSILDQGTGATVKGIKAKLLKLIKIYYPKRLDDQKNIALKLDELNQKTKDLESIYTKKIAALDELKKSLLQKAFSGELTKEVSA
jgi:type I restriction enzyme, S subunit